MTEFTKNAGAWLEAARAGSPEALGQALEAYRRYLLLVAQRNLDPQLQAKGGASDLVQETFLEAQHDFGQFHGTTEEELLAWLRRLLLNNLSNFARRYRDTDKRAVARELALPSDGSTAGTGGVAGPDPTPSAMAMEREQAQALQRALTRLPAEYRRVIELRYQEGKSFEDIGRLLNKTPDAARKLWSRAMERLRLECEGPS
jgi:RNA polymerase sigma-70 factor (ECF subfamily)